MQKSFIEELRELLKERPFNQELQEFLNDRCDELDYSQLSPRFQEVDQESDRLYAELKTLLSEDGRSILLKLSDSYNRVREISTNTAYREGFKEGLHLILQSLIY